MDVNVVSTLLGRVAAFRDEAIAIRDALGDELPEGLNALETRMMTDVKRQLDTVVPALRRRLR